LPLTDRQDDVCHAVDFDHFSVLLGG